VRPRVLVQGRGPGEGLPARRAGVGLLPAVPSHVPLEGREPAVGLAALRACVGPRAAV
jgi:hypothetical protein